MRGLTQEDDGTQQDGDQGSGAEARAAAQSLHVAQLHPALAVAGAHPDRECAGAALHGVVPVGDHHGDQVDALVEAAVAGATRQDAGRVVWEEQTAGEESELRPATAPRQEPALTRLPSGPVKQRSLWIQIRTTSAVLVLHR